MTIGVLSSYLQRYIYSVNFQYFLVKKTLILTKHKKLA